MNKLKDMVYIALVWLTCVIAVLMASVVLVSMVHVVYRLIVGG